MTIYRLHFRESPTLHSVVSIVSATCSAPIQMTLFLLQPKIHPTFPSHGNSAMSFLSWRKKSFTSIVACWPWVYWNELLRSQVLCWAWQGGRITAHALENNELFEMADEILPRNQGPVLAFSMDFRRELWCLKFLQLLSSSRVYFLRQSAVIF